MRFAILVDHEPSAALARIFLALGEMKIPRTKDVSTDTNVSQVSMVALKGPLAGHVGLTAYLDSRVALAGQAIAKSQFKIRKLAILPDQIG